MRPFRGKRILVSGAGSGIGSACARRLGELGAELILAGRRVDPLRETWPQAVHLALDHTDEKAVARFAKDCPPLDGMVLSAGALALGTVESTTPALFERMLAANLKGPWNLCHHLGPLLRDHASVVLMGSNVGIRAIPDSAAYCVSKAGVHMLAQVLALEWAGRGIRCNAIAPGPVHTPMVDHRLKASADPVAALEALAGVNPLRRLGQPEEIASLAIHLLGDESRWTTGTVIPIDGGATAVF
jgi:2-keto-3-deoxy-L-fuconate dehydrogenase